MRAQILGELRFFRPFIDGHGAETHSPRKLNSQMSEPADPLNPNQIARAQAGVAKSVEGRYASAEERGGFRGRELIRNGSERSCFGNHHLGITPVGSDSRYDGVQAVRKVSAKARLTFAVLPAQKADTYPLPDLPFRNIRTDLLDSAHDLMPRNSWQFQAWIISLYRC